MRMIRPQAGLLALLLAACFAPEGDSSITATGTTTVPGTTTTAADPTNEPTTAPGTTDPATSTPDTTGSPTTTTTGDSSSTSTTTATTSTSTTDTTTTTTTTTTSTTTGDDSTAATTLVDPECLADADCPNIGGECQAPACVDGLCTVKNAPAGSFCNGFEDQCDGLGLCIDCVNNGGCGECCVCSNGACIPA